MRTPALERAVVRGRRGATRPDRCGMCSAGLPDGHPHMLDLDSQRPVCVCRPCSLLFVRPVAGNGRYRLIPERRRRVEGLRPGMLRVPVGLAFFVPGETGVTAHYPSPGGATRWEVDPPDWAAALEAFPPLAGMVPEVEALLVNTAKGRSDAWVVPVTDCYRLVATVREHWEGLSGGNRVWKAVEDFFCRLDEEAEED